MFVMRMLNKLMKILSFLFFILFLNLPFLSFSTDSPSNTATEKALVDSSPEAADNLLQGKEVSQVSLVSSLQTAKPGQIIPIGLLFHLQPGWHTYWSYAGETGKPLNVHFSFSDLLLSELSPSISSPTWPIPHRYKYQISTDKAIYSFIYEKEVLIPFQLKIPDKLNQDKITIKAKVEWLVCKDVCFSLKKQTTLHLLVSHSSVISKKNQQLFQKWKKKSPEQATLSSWFRTKNSKKIITFEGEEQRTCLDIYPLQREDFSPAPPKPLAKEKGCVFEVTSGSSELPKISGLLLHKGKDGKIKGSLFTSIEKAPFNLLWFLILAFVGGLILNIMPCVLPVIFLKLYNTMELKEQTGRSLAWLNFSYVAGVVSSFLLLALLISISKTAGESIGWGFHLQSSVFVTLLSLLFLLMGFYLLNLLDIPLPKVALNFKGEKTFSHFLTGVLSTTAASPCTVPFMASAVGFAFSRSYLEIFVIFLFLGLGLSFPYLLLSSFPAFLKRLPGPGKWMERLKAFLALPLFGTALWLLWLLFFQLNQKIFLITLSLLVLTVSLLLIRKFFNKSFIRILLFTAALGVLSTLIVFQKIGNTLPLHTKSSYTALNAQSFSPDAIKQAREKEKNIFIAFGAEWCLTCKLNERLFDNQKVIDFFKTHSIQFYYGDWTNNNPLITNFLEKYGYKGVPFYIFFKGSEKTVILPSFLTSKSLLKKLQSALEKEN